MPRHFFTYPFFPPKSLILFFFVLSFEQPFFCSFTSQLMSLLFPFPFSLYQKRISTKSSKEITNPHTTPHPTHHTLWKTKKNWEGNQEFNLKKNKTLFYLFNITSELCEICFCVVWCGQEGGWGVVEKHSFIHTQTHNNIKLRVGPSF